MRELSLVAIPTVFPAEDSALHESNTKLSLTRSVVAFVLGRDELLIVVSEQYLRHHLDPH